MGSLLKIVVIIISLVAILFVTSPNTSSAKNSTEISSTIEKNNFLKVLRVLENGKWYIYIYTDSGIFVSKFEEL